MSRFKIALAQYPLTQHKSFLEWQAHTHDWCKKAAKNDADLLVFPEYGSMELISTLPRFRELSLAQQLNFLQGHEPAFKKTYQEIAKELKVDILAPSFPTRISKKFVNRAHLFHRSGEFDYQDKYKMTRFEDEDWGISEGEDILKVFDLGYTQVGISICFDAEFPMLASLLAHRGAELLLVPSCTETLWGHNRVHVGARARALENQFVVGVCPVVKNSKWCEAIDKNTGFAALYGPSDLGFPEDGVIKQGTLNKVQWLYAEVNPKSIETVREKGGVFNFSKSSEMKTLAKYFQVQKVKLS